MTLKKREKILAAAVAALLAVSALYWIWPSGGDSLASLRAKIASLDSRNINQKDNAGPLNLDDLLENLNNKKIEYQKQAVLLKKDLDRLPAFHSRALPANPDAAKREYQNWLLKLSDDKFKNVSLDAEEPQTDYETLDKNSRVIYVKLRFTVNCQGTLDELTRFLFDFYSAGHLHKICSIKISPVLNKPAQLTLRIVVEALSLPDSKQTDKLSAEKSNRLKLPTADAYIAKIAKRDPFVPYAPARPNGERKEPAPPAKIDPLQFTFLTAILEADGVPEAWLYERPADKVYKVHEGEEFTIGKVKGKVNRIGPNDIDVEIDGQTRTIGYGNSLKM